MSIKEDNKSASRSSIVKIKSAEDFRYSVEGSSVSQFVKLSNVEKNQWITSATIPLNLNASVGEVICRKITAYPVRRLQVLDKWVLHKGSFGVPENYVKANSISQAGVTLSNKDGTKSEAFVMNYQTDQHWNWGAAIFGEVTVVKDKIGNFKTLDTKSVLGSLVEGKPLNVPYKEIVNLKKDPKSQVQELLFLGIDGSLVKYGYKKFENDFTKPIEEKTIDHDISFSKKFALKGLEFEITDFTKGSITYSITKNFD